MTRLSASALLWVILLAGSCSTAAGPGPETPGVLDANAPPTAARPDVQPWPEASARFRASGSWLGADSAYSIALEGPRILWLFADTFIDPAADGSREDGPNFFIRNSVGIQSASTLERARTLPLSNLALYWGPDREGVPTSFFQDLDDSATETDVEHGQRWVWPLHGAVLPDGRLLLFRMRVHKEEGGLGFREDSWDAVAIDDTHDAPDRWRPRLVAGPVDDFHLLVGSSVLTHEGYLYAYAVDTTSTQRAIHLARWPVEQLLGLREHALDDPQWWTERGFLRQSALPKGVAPTQVFSPGQVELSVHYDAGHQRFVEVQMQGLLVGDANTQVALRTAPRPQGPWSALTPIFRPTEASLDNAASLAAYAAKAHPEQRGADLVVTYMVNDLEQFPPGDALYYPQVLRIRYP